MEPAPKAKYAQALNVVGISAHFHDAACCVLCDGELVSAAQEERFTRVKHDPSLPRNAFRRCLADAGLTIADVDCVAYYEDPRAKLARQLWMGLPQVPPLGPQALFRLDATRPEREIRELLGWDGPIEFVPHHVSHAASAYYFSGFEDAATLTVDAVGEWTTTAYGRARGAALELFEEVRFPHSFGLLYSALTSYLGFDVNDAEYKVMGLAPYGEPKYVDRVAALVASPPGGQIVLDLRYFDFGGGRMFTDELCTLFGNGPREPESGLEQFHADVARSVQVVLEEILLAKIAWLHERVPSPRLCMAGGVALNCVAVGRIVREGPFREVFVQPAASDAGGALGAAAVAHIRLTGTRPSGVRLRHVSLGPSYDPDEIARWLVPAATEVADYRGRENALLEDVAARLAAGEVVGWFHGRMELGPRALGNRSILADPRDAGMRDHVNTLVKKRESFRPFAPAVLAERAADHFDLDHPAPFMLETSGVRSALDLPAITHVDGSARVQTVERDTSPRFHRLLEAFERATGCPVLLNTSFNLRGEPIVCTPEDALRCFLRSGLDCLVLEDFVLERSAVPRAWQGLFDDAVPLPSPVPDSVYTLL